MDEIKHPKVFISYSWSSPEHEEWVIRLATDLRQNGVDVILDKWDLKEGHDKFAFILFLISELHNDYLKKWWPDTLCYIGYYYNSFEIFIRAESKKYFENIKILFNIQTPNEFRNLIENLEKSNNIPYWDGYQLKIKQLSNFDRLATKL